MTLVHRSRKPCPLPTRPTRCHRPRRVADFKAARSEFADLWGLGEVAVLQSERKTLLHPHAGQLDVQCDIVLSPGTGNRLLMFRPQPGTQTAAKLDFIRVLGQQKFPTE